MSTRGVIARETGEGQFKGRYHHWDSYPEGLGASLWSHLHNHFDGDLDAMLEVLLVQHPAGWSTIVSRDFHEEPGFLEFNSSSPDRNQPQCYCHGDRSEEARTYTEEDASGSGVEWAYVFDEKAYTMKVLSSYTQDGQKMVGMFGLGDPDAEWHIMAVFDLYGPEPDWVNLTQGVPEIGTAEDPDQLPEPVDDLDAAFARGQMLKAMVDARADLERARDYADVLPESFWTERLEGWLSHMTELLEEEGVGAPAP